MTLVKDCLFQYHFSFGKSGAPNPKELEPTKEAKVVGKDGCSLNTNASDPALNFPSLCLFGWKIPQVEVVVT